MLTLLPTKSPAPMMPPSEMSATCRERSVRRSEGTAFGETAIGAQFTQTPARAVIGASCPTPETRNEVDVPRLRCARGAPHRLPGAARADASGHGDGVARRTLGGVPRRLHRGVFPAQSELCRLPGP